MLEALTSLHECGYEKYFYNSPFDLGDCRCKLPLKLFDKREEIVRLKK